MNNEDEEEIHYRRIVKRTLDSFLEGHSTSRITVITLLCLLPISAGADQETETLLTMLLDDLAELPTRRPEVENDIVAVILDAVLHDHLIRELKAAIDALAARGKIVMPAMEPGKFRINGLGSYSSEDVLAEASRY